MKPNSIRLAGLLLVSITAWPAAAVATGPWVKDEQISSQAVLAHGLAFREWPVDERSVLVLVRRIMAEELSLTLADENQPHRLAGATTPKTILPQPIGGSTPTDLSGADYSFLLEIQVKAIQGGTCLTAQARPVYRPKDPQHQKTADPQPLRYALVLTSDPRGAQPLGLGSDRLVVISTVPEPEQARASGLPDAARRSAALVRGFMLLVDQHMADLSTSARP